MTASTPTQRWADDGIVANALHPGGSRTAYALDPAAADRLWGGVPAHAVRLSTPAAPPVSRDGGAPLSFAS